MNTCKHYILAALGAVAFVSTSCSDFLDKEQDKRVDIEEGTASDIEDRVLKLMVAAYPDQNYALISEMSSDNLIDNVCPHRPYDPDKAEKKVSYNRPSYELMDEELFNFQAVKSSDGSGSPAAIWSSYYGSITACNYALKAISKAEQMEKAEGRQLSDALKAARAEACAIRAYDHFILVNLFAQAYKDPIASKADQGIPYSTGIEDKVHVHYDRLSVAEVYDRIEQDLDTALADVSDINYKMPKYRFNKDAVYAFAARFYLFKRDYDKVIEYADKVLGEGTAQLPDKLMKYDQFDGCVTSTDYTNVWIAPENPNNLMLLSTYSIYDRHIGGRRYAWNSDAVINTFYHYCQGAGYSWWLWYCHPMGYVAGFLFYMGSSEYGFVPTKVGEKFQYTDKVAGIGYAHIIRREFTCTNLLLERAEAKLLCSRHDLRGCADDLQAYDRSRLSFNKEDADQFGVGTSKCAYLDDNILQAHYSSSANPNCFDNWDFTQNMSSQFVVPAECVTMMNAVNDMRRFEQVLEGFRFFDLKRWGIGYSHHIGKWDQTVGKAIEERVDSMPWNDPRRALEIGQSNIAAGMSPSRPDKYLNDKPDNQPRELYQDLKSFIENKE